MAPALSVKVYDIGCKQGFSLTVRILLVEDDLRLAEVMRAGLVRHGMVVDIAISLAEASSFIAMRVHNLVLLDRQLPDGDGIAFVSRARKAVAGIPVIILSARGELPDRVTGLDHGADDYLVKPAALEEILARIRAVTRRPNVFGLPSAKIGCLEFDFASRQAFVNGVIIPLPRRQLLVLEALVLRHSRAVRREALQEAVYGIDDNIQSNALDGHVSRVRRALVDAGANVEIHVVRGIGYLLREAQ